MGYIGKVPADVLIDPHVDSASIVDSTIVTADIANDAVTSAKLAQNSVDSSELIDGSVDNSHLAGSIAMNKTLLSAGTGLTLSTNTLNVDAAQTQITSVGTLTGLASSGTIVLGDLDIIPTSSNVSVIKHDSGSGSLTLQGDQVNIKNRAGDETGLAYNDGGGVTFGGSITQSANANLRHTITAGGSGEASLVLTANNSTGDSFVRWETNSTTFCLGFDNSDSDKFILSAGSDPHSNSVINIQPDGSSIAIDKPLSFTDVVTGETNSHISYTAGQGTDTVTGGAFRAPGSDIVTGRLFLQGYQNGATDLVGFNNESSQLVLYNYTDSAYMVKLDHTGNVSINGDRFMLMESNTDKGFFGKDDWATSGGSADNVNVGSYSGQVKLTAGAGSSSTSNIVCLTDKSSHFNGYINVEGDMQHKASSGSGVTVYKLWQQNGGYTGDIEIVCTASSWKSFIYDLCVIGHGGGGNWRGFAYHNAGITHGYQSVNNNNDGVGALSLTTSGQSMTFTVPLSATVTHVLIEFTLSTGGGDLITQDDIAISID